MEKILTSVKETCQYVGIILLACGAAVWLKAKDNILSCGKSNVYKNDSGR